MTVPGAHRNVTGLDVVSGAAHIGTRRRPTQNPHARRPAVGPPQREDRIGQRGQRGPGVHPGGLPWLQAARCARTGLDGSHHRQDQPLAPVPIGWVAGRVVGWLTETIAAHLADTQHVDAAHRVAVDRGLIETGQRPLGHHFLGAHQSLRLGDGDTYRPRSHRGGRYPGLLLLHRTHSAPLCPQALAGAVSGDLARRGTPGPALSPGYCSVRPNRATNHRRKSGP